MGKKHLWKKTAALVLALGLTLGATGCEFLVADNVRDLAQVVATVDITDELSEDNAGAASVMDDLIADKAISTDVYKRDLVSLFLSQGQTYIQYGYAYKDVFNMFMDELTNRKIRTQYALSYFVTKGLNDSSLVTISLEDYKTQELAKVTDAKEKSLLKSNPQVLTMKYYLTDFGKTDEESMEAYYKAVYQLQSSFNSSLDSAEEGYIQEHTHDHSHEDSRTLPTGANTAKSDYLPMKDGELNYGIYTGRNALDTCGEYEKIKGSTKSTRMKAYNTFLYNLQSYGLIEEGENASNITQLNYYYQELSSTLGDALEQKYYEELQGNVENNLTDEYVQNEYATLLENQTNAYNKDYSAFATAMDGVSDTAFLLYGLPNYGYVYNILLPFSTTQTQLYSAAKSKFSGEALYQYRETLLAKIEGKDLRGAWFCEDDAEHYAYEKDGEYYFFEDNFTNENKYETLTHYAGNYAYNGSATQNDDGEWETKPNKLKINDFMDEFVTYVSATAGIATSVVNYETTYGNYYADADKKEIDYGGFVYATGKFDLGEVKSKDYFNEDTTAYKALAAVNELMFAYSTDTGCLNKYMGYSVNANKTSFVSEFEYAAQMVVKQGVGSYAVVPSDYGWHIIYCSYKFDGGEVYTEGYNHAERETEGTFSYFFYEALKSTSATTLSNSEKSRIVKAYEESVSLFVERYQDLLDLA